MRPTERNVAAEVQIFTRALRGAASVFLLCAGVVLGTTAALAQYTTARLSGTVMDNSSLAVAGASVTVEQVTTGYTQSVKTGSAGDYLFPSLPIGSYRLTVEM